MKRFEWWYVDRALKFVAILALLANIVAACVYVAWATTPHPLTTDETIRLMKKCEQAGFLPDTVSASYGSDVTSVTCKPKGDL